MRTGAGSYTAPQLSPINGGKLDVHGIGVSKRKVEVWDLDADAFAGGVMSED